MSGKILVPKEIKGNLEPGEEVKNIVETVSVMKTPEFLAVTDRRVLYLNKKRFGRYDFEAIPYMKMRDANAKLGKVMWGEFVVEGEEKRRIHLRRVKKEGIVSTFKSMKEAINAIAIEPISIIHKKGLLKGEEWSLSKPPETIIRQKVPAPVVAPKAEEDPLKLLKIRFVKGEITKEEYEEMKKVLES